MKHKLPAVFGIFLLTINIQATETKIISDSGFQNLWLWQLSNTSMTDQQGISLSKESRLEFDTPATLWTMEEINGSLYLGTADEARIIQVNTDKSEKEIFRHTNKSLTGDLAATEDGFIAAFSPDAELIRFDRNNKPITNLTLSNTYIWDIIPNHEGSYDILTGLPAQIYRYQNDSLTETADFEDEEHLIKGFYTGPDLWILSEKALYKKTGDKITAFAGFSGIAAGVTYHEGVFYVIQSITTPAKNDENNKDQIISSLLAVKEDGSVQELMSLPGFYFTAVAAQNKTIIIGGGQFGLYIEYDTVTGKHLFSTLGEGKVLTILPSNGNMKIMTSDPSAIWTVENKIARQGIFISEVYDVGSISTWGTFNPNISAPQGTSVKFFVQSGVTKNPLYWSDWQEVAPGSKIPAAPAQFIRYKAQLLSDGKAPPYVYGVEFPYTQHNLAPKINSLSLEQKNNILNVSWNASDPNNDTLIFDIYLAADGMQKIKINPEPLSATNFSFSNDAFPSGVKRITVAASDLPSNSPETALTHELSALPVVFDSEPPVIGEILLKEAGSHWEISVTISDDASLLKEVSYLINGQNNTIILPEDGILDEKTETFLFKLPKSQGFFLQIQAADTAGNQSSKGLFIRQ